MPTTAQGELFPDEARTDTAGEPSNVLPSPPATKVVPGSHPKGSVRKTIQDLLINEGLTD